MQQYRLAWVSDLAQSVWEPRLRVCHETYKSILLWSVIRKLNDVAIIEVKFEMLSEFYRNLRSHSLYAYPINDTLPSQGQSPSPLESNVSLAVGSHSSLEKFMPAWDAGECSSIAKLLGYPDCCAEFFKNTWVDNGIADPTWEISNGGLNAGDDLALEVREWNPLLNQLCRWIGVRILPYIPCSPTCPDSSRLSHKLLGIGYEIGDEVGASTISEILSWPVEWSALNGLAEIRHPVVKVCTSTDVNARRRTVRFLSDRLPNEAAKGISFPWNLR